MQPTEIVTENIISWVSGGSKKADGTKREQSGTKFRDSKTRSKTFEGIAKAMAEQWGTDKPIKHYEQITIFDYMAI